jgi:hypothetical protein
MEKNTGDGSRAGETGGTGTGGELLIVDFRLLTEDESSFCTDIFTVSNQQAGNQQFYLLSAGSGGCR